MSVSNSLLSRLLMVIVVTSLIFASANLNAQIPLGVKAGITANEIVFRKPANSFGLPYNYQTMTALHAGLFTKIKIIKNFAIVPEVQYIEKYCSYHGIAYGEIKLKYVEIPILFSYQPLKWLSVEAGGSWGLNIYDNQPFENYNENDAGLLGGIRVNLSTNVSFTSRYYHGLRKLGPFISEAFNPFNDYMAYNQNLQFAIAYYFGEKVKTD